MPYWSRTYVSLMAPSHRHSIYVVRFFLAGFLVTTDYNVVNIENIYYNIIHMCNNIHQ